MSRVGDLPGADGAAPVPPVGRRLAGRKASQLRPGVATVAPPDRHSDAGARIAPDAATCGEGATPIRPRSVVLAMAAHPATLRTPPWHILFRVAGHPVGVRLLEPTDGPNVTDVFRHLSPASRRRRFLSTNCEYPPDLVDALGSTSRPGRYALVAALLDRPRRPIIAIAEFVRNAEPWVAEPAITVLDAYQGHRWEPGSRTCSSKPPSNAASPASPARSMSPTPRPRDWSNEPARASRSTRPGCCDSPSTFPESTAVVPAGEGADPSQTVQWGREPELERRAAAAALATVSSVR